MYYEDSRGQGFRDSGVMLRNYKDLKVWQKSYQFCLEIYKITKGFPKEETYGLTSQIRRAGVSVPSNIAEGYRRKTTPEYIRSLWDLWKMLNFVQVQGRRSAYGGLTTPEKYASHFTGQAGIHWVFRGLKVEFHTEIGRKGVFWKVSLYIAYSSNCEVETQILLSGDLGYIEAGKLNKLQDVIGKVERMLKGSGNKL